MEIGAPSNSSGRADQFMHKNRLQEYTQRATLPLPMYQTINEGHPHAPQFRASVVVDGRTFTSPCTFVNKKAAEQDVARIALEGISTKIQLEGVPMIKEDSTFCKSILYEYATKMNSEKPTYTTSKGEGLLPIFVSYAVFNGETFTGRPARNKKEAEQMAARAAIESILANSNTRTMMCEIIKSKGKLYAAVPKGRGLLCDKNMVQQSQIQENTDFTVQRNEAHVALKNMHTLPGNACSADRQLVQVAATPLYPPQAIKVEGYTYMLSSGTGGNGYEQYVAQGDLSARVVCSTNNASRESRVDQDYQVSGATKQFGASVDVGNFPKGAINVRNGSEPYVAQDLLARVMSSTNVASKEFHIGQDNQVSSGMKQFGASMHAGNFPTGAMNVGNGSEPYAAQVLSAGLVSSTNNASKDSHSAEDIQVVDGLKETGMSTEHGDFPTGNINTGRKRSNEQEKGDDCKKAKTDEQVPPTQPLDNTENAQHNG